ncbi:MAG: AAA family ATPase [Gammaproteobacteria bacterium]|nr:AAA family ATPase [Gammaproteobacteria bacterium]
MAAKRKLPTGIQTFRTLREEGCYYVDKTGYALRLAQDGAHYFLSRPRRFGKSLFLDTLKELFEGSEELFRGLAVHQHWDWSVRHPVLRFSFAGGSYKAAGALERNLDEQLQGFERHIDATSGASTQSGRFRWLLRELHERTSQRAIVLVDEYDKPILDAIDAPEVAEDNRDLLRSFYGTVKDADAHVRFSFFTGVSKFSKVSVFSDLNNLTDLTLHPRYSSICGYTDADLDGVFAPEIEGLDRQAIRRWYNGYCWLGDEKVYNPFDVLLLFEQRRFRAHWFETGTPAFLIEKLLERGVSAASLDGMIVTDSLLSTFDVHRMPTATLLFQTGYLTIAEAIDDDDEPRYRLTYPNHEVRQSFNRSLLQAMTPETTDRLMQSGDLRRLLQGNDFQSLRTLLESFFSSIPYNWHVNNNIADYEGYYASLFYTCFMASGLDVRTEDASASGRLDMALLFNSHVYLFEFKVQKGKAQGAALAQLRDRGYHQKYRHLNQPIYLIGVEFSAESRNLIGFDVEHAPA